MDYKYIEQLLEHYWNCETSLEEEEILRMFFSQKNVPASLLQYRDLFCYEQKAKKSDVLGADFDERMLAMVGEGEEKKARIISIRERLMPLFRAAAIVAIILTLGNAMQTSFQEKEEIQTVDATGYSIPQNGKSVAKTDTVKFDVSKTEATTQNQTE